MTERQFMQKFVEITWEKAVEEWPRNPRNGPRGWASGWDTGFEVVFGRQPTNPERDLVSLYLHEREHVLLQLRGTTWLGFTYSVGYRSCSAELLKLRKRVAESGLEPLSLEGLEVHGPTFYSTAELERYFR